ncbi:MAG: mechanosensitive ion channel [Ilumatobacteraceae bacterium]|nr:mechanosensitive ion channel [Ilumatobacteraceae bacterium]
MIETLLSWLIGPALTGPFVLVVIAVAAVTATRVSRVVVRRIIRHVAKRSLRFAKLPGQPVGLWRTRAARVGDVPGEAVEQRRRQRIDAAARMVNHLVGVLIWIVASIVAFHLLDVDPAFFLSSAGFMGAALAIGGQHKVNDYLTGLSVHFEDRYGVGDEVVVESTGLHDPVRGVVDHIGLFSTRIRDTTSTLHFPNSALATVRNLSQEAAASTLRLNVPRQSDAAVASDLLRGLAGTDGLTDLVFVGDLAAREVATGEIEVDVQTSRALDGQLRERLVHRAERAFDDRHP